MPLAHSVLPPDDSSLQWSEPGSGITEDPSATLESIYARMVTRYDKSPHPATSSLVELPKGLSYSGVVMRGAPGFGSRLNDDYSSRSRKLFL
jgi:hypothetical protein